MIFKKFIGALTALVMTMTAFVGLATEVGALSNDQTEFVLNLYLNDSDTTLVETLYANDLTELMSYMVPGKLIESTDSTTYVVAANPFKNADYNKLPNSCTLDIYVSTASTINIKIIGNGAINIDGTNYPNNSNFSAVIGTSHTIVATAAEGNTITNISLGNNTDDWSFSTDNKTATRVVTMPDTDVTLTVNFSTITSSNITTNIVNASLPDNDFGNMGNNCGSLTILNGMNNDGTITANSGTTIQVVAHSETGYSLKGVSITDNNNLTIEPSVVNGVCSFVMPDTDVTVTATFEWINALPIDATVAHIDNFDEYDSDAPASLWEGTLNGRGAQYKPLVSVTVDGHTKNVIGTTTISGNSSILVAIVVDSLDSKIDSISLTGVAPDSNIATDENGSYGKYDAVSTDTTEGGNE